MAVQGVPYRLQDSSLYNTDFGATANFNLSLRPPSDLTDENIDSILECIGAERREPGGVICSERGSITYRRLIFYRSNGSSMTVVAPNREAIITQAQCIWDILSATDFQPICIKLEGEKHRNVIDDLLEGDREGGGTANPIRPPEGAGRNRFFFSGSMRAYKSDAVFGAQLSLSFKMDTDADQTPYSSLSTQINGCLKELIDASICGGAANARDARKYVVTLLTQSEDAGNNDSPEVQSITIPVAENSSAEITNCGRALASRLFVQCLEYEGESNARLHRLLT
ncbi:hypothetical protein [Cyanothece sp. BG0011]|uniref:hypothetical protein n=1 Tax=Cyanothece sp. BG0011 TaxID=2082950 RepID=UPI000D1FD3F6|nr:hypothetical protein [Cyanothece sp. BG0011]